MRSSISYPHISNLTKLTWNKSKTTKNSKLKKAHKMSCSPLSSWFMENLDMGTGRVFLIVDDQAKAPSTTLRHRIGMEKRALSEALQDTSDNEEQCSFCEEETSISAKPSLPLSPVCAR